MTSRNPRSKLRPVLVFMPRVRLASCLAILVACLAAAAPPPPAREPEIWLEIPGLVSRVEANGGTQLSTSDLSVLRIHINHPPSQLNYGDIFAKVNTESANIIMSTTSTAEGVICELDLEHRGGFKLHPGRNSVEIALFDAQRRLYYASFLLQAQEGEGERFVAAPPEKLTGEKYAVIIGISRYDHAGGAFPNLRYADRDAMAFRDFLLSPGGGRFKPENIRFLVDQAATSQNVRSALFTFLTKPRPEDLVVIYWAGHGAPDPNDRRNLYLLTYDTRVEDMGGTAFPMWQLQDVFGRILKAKRVITFTDSCHSYGISGQALRASAAENNLVNQYLTRYASEADRAVVTASDISQLSYEGEDWGGGHGVFTFYLLRGLDGEADANRDGTVTAGELFAYVRDRVSAATNGDQRPVAFPGLAADLPLAGAAVQGGEVKKAHLEPPASPGRRGSPFASQTP